MFRQFTDQMRPSRRLAILAGSLLLLSTPPAGAAGSLSPLGNWARDDGATRMLISQCGSQLCAVNTWVKDPQGSEKVGDKLIITVKQASPMALSGSAFDVRRNRTYSITITLANDRMKTTGCVLLGVLCKSAGWTRSG